MVTICHITTTPDVKQLSSTYSSGIKSNGRFKTPSHGPDFSQFYAVFRNILPSCWLPSHPRRIDVCLYGEFWIRPWKVCFKYTSLPSNSSSSGEKHHSIWMLQVLIPSVGWKYQGQKLIYSIVTHTMVVIIWSIVNGLSIVSLWIADHYVYQQ